MNRRKLRNKITVANKLEIIIQRTFQRNGKHYTILVKSLSSEIRFKKKKLRTELLTISKKNFSEEQQKFEESIKIKNF